MCFFDLQKKLKNELIVKIKKSLKYGTNLKVIVNSKQTNKLVVSVKFKIKNVTVRTLRELKQGKRNQQRNIE